MKNIKSIITILLILVIVFPLIIRGINYIKEKKEQKNRDESQKEMRKETSKKTESVALRISSDGKWKVVSPPDRIRYDGEYGEVYRGVLPGSMISIEDLTEPCCVITKSDKEYHSEGNHNYRNNVIPNSRDNTELRFKSQNGKIGYLNIYYWIPIK